MFEAGLTGIEGGREQEEGERSEKEEVTDKSHRKHSC